MSFDIRIVCQRCKVDFLLQPGFPIEEYCETCKRILGCRISPDNQLGLNRRYEWQRQRCERAPWGNEHRELRRVFSKLASK